MKRAFLVLGAESTGTRLVTRLLLASGCVGDGDHVQRWDSETPTDPLVVWRRSIPHNKVWPDIGGMADSLRALGYDVSAIVTSRDWSAAVPSQVAIGHVPDAETALRQTRAAYPYIFAALLRHGIPYVLASYESLVTRPEAIGRLCDLLGLPRAEHEDVVDGNEKWFSGPEPVPTGVGMP